MEWKALSTMLLELNKPYDGPAEVKTNQRLGGSMKDSSKHLFRTGVVRF